LPTSPDDGSGGKADDPAVRCSTPVSLPSGIAFDGDFTSVAVGDMDADGCRDIATVVFDVASGHTWLEVAWGDPSGMWSDRWRQPIGVVPVGNGSRSRDGATNIVEIIDWDRDARLDVLTSAGVAFGAGHRTFDWRPLGNGDDIGQPVGLIPDGSRFDLVIGTFSGGLVRCRTVGDCQRLPDTPVGSIAVDELVIGDFDHDGIEDIVAGYYWDDPQVSWLWSSRDGFSHAARIEVDGVDLEVGDVDTDGYPDLVAQRVEWISDFPSETHYWKSTAAGFVQMQRISNLHNHNDAASLVDIDRDGCLDYLHTGVDIPVVAVRWGDCQFLGAHHPDQPLDVGWHEVAAAVGIGVQCIDLDREEPCELLLRSWEPAWGTLKIFSAPTKL
jgi:hypothetical protein